MQREPLPWHDPIRAAVSQAASKLLFDLGPAGAERITGLSRNTLKGYMTFRRAPSLARARAVLIAGLANEALQIDARSAL